MLQTEILYITCIIFWGNLAWEAHHVYAFVCYCNVIKRGHFVWRLDSCALVFIQDEELGFNIGHTVWIFCIHVVDLYEHLWVVGSLLYYPISHKLADQTINLKGMHQFIFYYLRTENVFESTLILWRYFFFLYLILGQPLAGVTNMDSYLSTIGFFFGSVLLSVFVHILL